MLCRAMSSFLVLLLLCCCAFASASVPSLTSANFKDEVFNTGRNAFVKFFAPWCGHCKAMAPAWEKLAETYDGSSSVLIAEVDCTVESDVCSQYGVRGYPTIKYFTTETGEEPQDYNGGRSFDDFKGFADDKLLVKCTLADQEGCSDKEKAYIVKAQKMGKEEVDKQLKRLSDMSSSSMKAELKAWVRQRVGILKQVASA